MSVTDEAYIERVEVGMEATLSPYERRVEQALAAHQCHPQPGLLGEAHFTVRCRTCGLVAQSETPISPLRVERCHQAKFVILVLGAA